MACLCAAGERERVVGEGTPVPLPVRKFRPETPAFRLPVEVLPRYVVITSFYCWKAFPCLSLVLVFV